MRTIVFILLHFLLISFCDAGNAIINSKQPAADPTNTVLVLPPYDFIASEGISPDIQQYLENALQNNTSVKLIKFSYKKFMGVAYQNVFDKKYCRPILQKIKVKFIIMTKIEQAAKNGNM
jgi:hypothetical protein